MFEKIRASDARFQDIFSITYNDFKLRNNFTASEIIHKTRSLKGVMEPFSDFGNTGLIKRAGFKDMISIFQWLCFKGYLCIKWKIINVNNKEIKNYLKYLKFK
mgnify:FL=1